MKSYFRLMLSFLSFFLFVSNHALASDQRQFKMVRYSSPTQEESKPLSFTSLLRELDDLKQQGIITDVQLSVAVYKALSYSGRSWSLFIGRQLEAAFYFYVSCRVFEESQYYMNPCEQYACQERNFWVDAGATFLAMGVYGLSHFIPRKSSFSGCRYAVKYKVGDHGTVLTLNRYEGEMTQAGPYARVYTYVIN